MVKLCIFDLDGTLTNTLPAITHFGNTALTAHGFSPIESERYKYLVGNGRDLLVHRMLAENGADTPENYDAVGKSYDAAYEADPLYGTHPYDGIPDLLQLLRENGIKTAVLSNKPDNVACDVVNLFFPNLFDAAHGQRSGVKTKPDPQGAIMILEELSEKPEEALFIGDTNVDINTGKNSGMRTIGALWGFRTEKELTEAGADFIAAKPLDIADIIFKIQNE
ncbi:MAG: HAD family hydrolase [Clostridiales bacterium]|nr:HAD family hydrolase [Clostridiales bacterium]